MDNELIHAGVKGMKWGVRRYQNKDGSLTPAGKKRYNKELARIREEERIVKNKQATKAKIDKLEARRKALEAVKRDLDPDSPKAKKSKELSQEKVSKSPKKKSISEMSNEELQAAIDRAGLEKQYKQAMSAQESKKVSKGKKLALEIIESSAKNIGTQAATWAIGTAFNKVVESLGGEPGAVNPKQGQSGKKDKKD